MTPGEAAAWMIAEYVRLNQVLYQHHASGWLSDFGSGQTYVDKSGYLRISKETLKIFDGLTPDIVYDFGEKFWRKRLPHDKPSRRQ